MRAVVLRTFGPPANLVAEEVAAPRAGPGEVLVEVRFASITFVETQIRAGRPPHPWMAPALPAVLGNGVGGIVLAVGAGVDRALAGRRVVTTTGGAGGYAERVAVDASLPLEVPAPLDLHDAVALLADGRTALSLIEAARMQPGERVLVEAAAGGVGSLLVQLARNAGAHVVAAAGGERKLALPRELGADAAVDYARAGWTDEAGPVDIVFDGVGGAIGAAAYGLLRPGGRFIAYGMASGAFTALDGEERPGVTVVRGVPLTPARMRELSAEALAQAAAGRLRPTVGQTFALARAADAHAAIESRATRGKTLLRV
jgi:NADPH2:quinone reductase